MQPTTENSPALAMALNEDRRSATIPLTIFTGFLLTCFVTWWAWLGEQQQIHQQAVRTATDLVGTLERSLTALPALSALVGHLDPAGWQALQHTQPTLIGVARSSGPEPLTWVLPPAEPVADLSAIPGAAASTAQTDAEIGRVHLGRDREGRRTLSLPLWVRQDDVRWTLWFDLERQLQTTLSEARYTGLEVSLFDPRAFARDPFFRGLAGPRSEATTTTPTAPVTTTDNSGSPRASSPFESTIRIGRVDWLVRIQPTAAFETANTGHLPLIWFITGSVISLLAGALVRAYPRG